MIEIELPAHNVIIEISWDRFSPSWWKIRCNTFLFARPSIDGPIAHPSPEHLYSIWEEFCCYSCSFWLSLSKKQTQTISPNICVHRKNNVNSKISLETTSKSCNEHSGKKLLFAALKHRIYYRCTNIFRSSNSEFKLFIYGHAVFFVCVCVCFVHCNRNEPAFNVFVAG